MKKIFSVSTTCLLIMDILFVKWMGFIDKSYTVSEFLSTVHESGGIAAYISKAEQIPLKELSADATFVGRLPSYVMLYIVLMIALLCLIRLILLVCNKGTRYLDFMIYSAGLLVLAVYFAFQGYDPGPGLVAAMVLIVVDFLGRRYLEDRGKIQEDARTAKEKAGQEHKEKKERTFFPGRYDRDFYHVVFKNFLYNRKSYLLFILGGSFSVVSLYTILGVLERIKKTGMADTDTYGNGIQSILGEILPVIVCFHVLLLALIITHYLRTRTYHYSIFYSLGIRKTTLGAIIAIEYVLCILLSYIIGAALVSILLPARSVFAAAISAGLFAIIVLIATLINYHLFEHKNLMKLSDIRHKSEKTPRHFLPVGIVIGCFVVAASVIRYWNPANGEKYSLYVWALAGCCILIYALAGTLLKRRQKLEKADGNDLLPLLPWRYRFRSNVRFACLLLAMHLMAGMIYIPGEAAVQTAKTGNELYPYDFVCMSYDEDEDFFSDLEEKWDIQRESYPMLRLTTPLGAPYSWRQGSTDQYRSVMWPQGQHMAISESTYWSLKGLGKEETPLELNGNEIHVVFQQDTSVKIHPFEWYFEDKVQEPRFRIGQPVRDYIYPERERIFPQYRIKSSEREILTGMLQNGQQENIVVLSDTYFEKIYRDTSKEGPVTLTLLTCNSQDYEQINTQLEKFKEKHVKDSSWDERIKPYYGRQEMSSDADSQHLLKAVSYLLILTGLLIGACLAFYIKYGLEEDELKRKYSLLRCMGMPRKEQVRLLSKEMGIMVWGSLLLALALSLPFIAGIAKNRMFTSKEITAFLLACCIIWGCYIVLYIMITRLVKRHYIRAVIR